MKNYTLILLLIIMFEQFRKIIQKLKKRIGQFQFNRFILSKVSFNYLIYKTHDVY